MVVADTGVYEVRRGWTVRGVLLILAGFGFVAGGVLLPDTSVFWRVCLVVFGAACGGLTLYDVLARRVALRVDAEGVTLGAVTAAYRSGRLFVPWARVVAIVLWEREVGNIRMPYVGVEQRAGGGDLHLDSRPIDSWRPDLDALASAVERFAPDVTVVDRRGGPAGAPAIRWRWAWFGTPIATAAATGSIWLAGTLTGADPHRWWRPAIMATGVPLVIACWHLVARPYGRWQALLAAIVTTTVLYQLLYRLVLDDVRSPWDGALSFTAAGWVGAIAYVALTQRLRKSGAPASSAHPR